MVETKENSVDFWSRLDRLDKRYIWWIIVILIVIVTIRPLGLPVRVSKTTVEFVDAIESLPEGSIILMEISTTAYAWDEIGSGAYAISKLILHDGHKLIMVGSQAPDSSILTGLVLEKTGWIENAKYGEDYVNLGFISGGEITVFNLARDFQFPEKDSMGVPFSEIPLLKDIKDANDIDMIIDIHSSVSVPEWYARHWVGPYGTKMIVCETAACIHEVVAYYKSGDYLGHLGGVRGIAEFELYTGFLGAAIKSLDAQSVINFYFILIVFVANLNVIVRRVKR